ncbi:DUF4249 domain-containing protein [Robiginitalea sp. M366]|uniref:DUF4249 domain-containing protein n=1 Tax=Robiginitalea aestuariiviva TaxID=3036903 RepID=UPI00240DA325|nr:DUF4249 domain-containing protein [Robiginitalea aestuariiviva]MDG1572648.1 DUF4249 domain-containing protein [Robiginitalea aestuariiviva]
MKRTFIAYRLFLPALLALMALGCVEELELETLQDAPEGGLLVVEAVLTDSVQVQQVLLSRSSPRLDLETDTVYNPFIPFGLGARDSVIDERGARVQLLSGSGGTFSFFETEAGAYRSLDAFALAPGETYTLEIRTASGAEYRSDPLQINGEAALTGLYAERETNAFGVEGIQIYADGRALQGDASRLRYAYEETYKVIAPYWNENEFRLTNYDPCALPDPTYTLEIIPQQTERQVCYNTVPSATVIQTSLATGGGSTINRFPVRFIPRDDFILTHRYSIVVRQYVQDAGAFGFFEALKRFSETESLFSQVQPGALTANVTRTDGTRENVLGYVEAASVSQRRIFFNYDDYFPGEALPPYPFVCLEHSSPESHVSYCFQGMSSDDCPQSIIERINLGLITYTGENVDNIGTCPGPYTYVNSVCGDCTLLGQNTIPEFWEE